MPNAYRPAALTRRVFSRKEALTVGLTDKQLASATWHRLIRGIYADSDLRFDHGLRIRGAARILPDTLAIAGPSAAWLHGIRLATVNEPVHVLTPRPLRFGPIQRVRVHTSHFPIEEDDLQIEHDHLITSPLRTAWDIGCWLRLDKALPFLDQLLAKRLITRRDLCDMLDWRPSIRGSKSARSAISLADPLAESPPESSLRALLHMHGAPAPTVQHKVFHNGSFVARVDLAWEEDRVALEYDGEYHASTDQMRRDRSRLNKLAAAGWRVIFATKEHVYGRAFPQLLHTLIGVLKHDRSIR